MNFKTYIESTGKKGVELAKVADHVSKDSGITIAVAPQFTDLKSVVEEVEIPVFSQHIDPIKPGAFTGHILAEAVKAAGASATLVNHSERRIKLSEIEEVLSLARVSDLSTLVCTDTPGVSAAVAALSPDMIAVEPPDLIGTGVAVSKARPELITDAIKRIRLIASVISSGLAFETATPVPMRSGGSTAIMSGLNAATAALTPGVSVQTKVERSETLARDRTSSISESLIRLSE